MLDNVVEYMPSPIDIPAIKGVNPKTDEEVERHAFDDEPFSALAFKMCRRDRFRAPRTSPM